MSCWRLKEWHEAGIWQKVHEALLAELNDKDRIDWQRAVVDSSSVRAVHGKKTGSNPTDRRKRGSKHHVISDGWVTPLAIILTAANAHDVTQLMPLLDAIPAIKGRRGRPRFRPEQVQGDRAYQPEKYRQMILRRGIKPVIAKRHSEHGSGLGKSRWLIERTLAWLHQFRRLRVRYERWAVTRMFSL